MEDLLLTFLLPVMKYLIQFWKSVPVTGIHIRKFIKFKKDFKFIAVFHMIYMPPCLRCKKERSDAKGTWFASL